TRGHRPTRGVSCGPPPAADSRASGSTKADSTPAAGPPQGATATSSPDNFAGSVHDLRAGWRGTARPPRRKSDAVLPSGEKRLRPTFFLILLSLVCTHS